jgi:hypothetical protein
MGPQRSNNDHARMARNREGTPIMAICTVEECTNIVLAKGLCRKHYLRIYRTGSLEVKVHRDLSAYERLMLKVEPNANGCLIYKGKLIDRGYVHVRHDNGLMRYGHVIVYEHFYGPVPTGLEVDHTCNTRSCLNHEHLEAMTHKENIRKAVELRGSDWGFGLLTKEERIEQAKNASDQRWSK